MQLAIAIREFHGHKNLIRSLILQAIQRFLAIKARAHEGEGDCLGDARLTLTVIAHHEIHAIIEAKDFTLREALETRHDKFHNSKIVHFFHKIHLPFNV